MKIAVINSPFASHIGRMIYVFEELLRRGHEVQLWGSGSTIELAKKYNIPYRFIPLGEKYLNIMQEDLNAEEYYTRVFFPMALDQLPAVLRLCDQEKPDLLEANTRVFAGVIASEITGIPVMTHCCSGNSFAQIPEDYYGYYVKGDESRRSKEIMMEMGRSFFERTDQWYNTYIASVYNLQKRENAIGLCSDRWALAHTVSELSKKRISSLPQVVLTGPIIQEDSVDMDFKKYRPYCYLTLGTCPWQKEQIKTRYLNIIQSLPNDYNIVVGLGNLFPKGELLTMNDNVKVFDQASQISAIRDSEFVVCHGGCQTVHEALRYGKPVIGIPSYAELREMINSVELQGAGCRISLSRINAYSLAKAVEAVTSEDCKKNALFLSKKLKECDGYHNILTLLGSM